MKDSKGRFIKIHSDVLVTCPCGATFVTTSQRTSIGRGKYCSKRCCYTYRNSPSGSDHFAWKGDEVGYSALHHWVESRLGKPNTCVHCYGSKDSKRFEWANVSGSYKRELTDWIRLCSKCHHAYDRIAERGWVKRKELQGV